MTVLNQIDDVPSVPANRGLHQCRLNFESQDTMISYESSKFGWGSDVGSDIAEIESSRANSRLTVLSKLKSTYANISEAIYLKSLIYILMAGLLARFSDPLSEKSATAYIFVIFFISFIT